MVRSRTLRLILSLSAIALLPVGRVWAQAVPAAKPAAAAPDGQPTMADLQSALEVKEYPTAVKLAAKLLALRGPAAAGLDRFAITMSKGYAQAGMKSQSTAIMTFKSAARETKDDHEIALSKWTAELFKTAGSTIYVSKTMNAAGQKPGPFDLLDPDQRKQAFGAMLDDQLALLDPKLKAATVSQRLPEIWPVLQQVIDLDKLDVIANTNDDKTSTLASSLLEHAQNLLVNELKSDWARVNDIDTFANVTNSVPTQMYINNTLVTQTVTKKNGLSDSNKLELKNIIDICQKIHDAAEAFMTLAKTDKGWSTILSDADRVASRASDVLNADYGTTTTTGTNLTTDTTNGLGGVTNQTPQFPGNDLSAQNTQPNTPPKRSNGPANTPGKTRTGVGQ